MRGRRAAVFQTGNLANPRAFGNRKLRRDQIDACHRLRNRMFHLNTRVNLHERHGAVRINEKLHRSGTLVARLLTDGDGRRFKPPRNLIRQERSRRLLDKLLIATLQRTVTRADCDNAAGSVAQHLHLHMTGTCQKTFDEAIPVAERKLGLMRGRHESLAHIFQPVHDLKASPAAAIHGFDGRRKAVLFSCSANATTSDGSRAGSVVPGAMGAPTSAAIRRASTLELSMRSHAARPEHRNVARLQNRHVAIVGMRDVFDANCCGITHAYGSPVHRRIVSGDPACVGHLPYGNAAHRHHHRGAKGACRPAFDRRVVHGHIASGRDVSHRDSGLHQRKLEREAAADYERHQIGPPIVANIRHFSHQLTTPPHAIHRYIGADAASRSAMFTPSSPISVPAACRTAQPRHSPRATGKLS